MRVCMHLVIKELIVLGRCRVVSVGDSDIDIVL